MDNNELRLEDLNDTGLRIFEVATNPENLTKSVSEKIELANVSRATWYSYMKHNESFLELVKNNINDLYDIYDYEVDLALIQSAKIVGRDGDKARELYYRIRKDYRPKIDITTNDNPILFNINNTTQTINYSEEQKQEDYENYGTKYY